MTLEQGNALRALAGRTAKVAKSATHPGVGDGDFDTGVIVHEYGHGVSNRLTGGPGVNCLSGGEQMGEGWSDFLAISMLRDPRVDDPEGRRGMGPYVLFQPDRTGNGIRVTPYSRNMTINPFTYDNIKTGGWRNGATIAAPHGVGWGWSSTLWDMTWDLVDRYGSHDNVDGDWDAGGNNRAIQYVMDGMKMQGCFPGFVAGRDGILAASEALGGEDTCLIWSSFARRGLGLSAVQGTTDRNDGAEAFDVPPACKAPGTGFTGPRVQQSGVTRIDAGATVPLQFDLGGDKGLQVLKLAPLAVVAAHRLRDAQAVRSLHGAGRADDHAHRRSRRHWADLQPQPGPLPARLADRGLLSRHLSSADPDAGGRHAAPGGLPLHRSGVALRTTPEGRPHGGRPSGACGLSRPRGR